MTAMAVAAIKTLAEAGAQSSKREMIALAKTGARVFISRMCEAI